MRKFPSVKSMYAAVKNYIRSNRVVRAKHFGLLDQSIQDTDSNVEKLEVYMRARELKVTNTLSKIKADIRHVKNIIPTERHDASIKELREVFTQMAKAADTNTKIIADKFKSIEKKLAKLDGFKEKLKISENYQQNMETLTKMQTRIENKQKEFVKSVMETLNLQADIRKEYECIKRDFENQIQYVRDQFTNAMAIQSKDILRRINEKIDSIGIRKPETA